MRNHERVNFSIHVTALGAVSSDKWHVSKRLLLFLLLLLLFLLLLLLLKLLLLKLLKFGIIARDGNSESRDGCHGGHGGRREAGTQVGSGNLHTTTGDEVDDVGNVSGDDTSQHEHTSNNGEAADKGVRPCGSKLFPDDDIGRNLIAEEDTRLVETRTNSNGDVLGVDSVLVLLLHAAGGVTILDWNYLQEIDRTTLLRISEHVGHGGSGTVFG